MNSNHLQQSSSLRYLYFNISLVYNTEVKYCSNSNLLELHFSKIKHLMITQNMTQRIYKNQFSYICWDPGTYFYSTTYVQFWGIITSVLHISDAKYCTFYISFFIKFYTQSRWWQHRLCAFAFSHRSISFIIQSYKIYKGSLSTHLFSNSDLSPDQSGLWVLEYESSYEMLTCSSHYYKRYRDSDCVWPLLLKLIDWRYIFSGKHLQVYFSRILRFSITC